MMMQINFDKETNKYLVTELELDMESMNYEIVDYHWVSEKEVADMFCDWESEVGVYEAESDGCVDDREVEQYTEDKIAQWWEDLNNGKKVQIDY